MAKGKKKKINSRKDKDENFLTLDEYLANYSKNHSFNNVIVLWFQKKESGNVKKSKEDWDKIIFDFFNF